MSSWKGILEGVMKEREIPKDFKGVKYRYTHDKGYRLKSHRVRDPINHRFYDPKREKQYNSQMSKFFNNQQKIAKGRRKYSAGTYDIITLREHDTKKKCKNISPIQSLPKERHFTRQCETDFDTLFGKNVKLSTLRKRMDYNPLSNRFDKHGEEERRNKAYRTNVMKRKKNLVSNVSNPILHIDVNGKSLNREKSKHGKGCYSTEEKTKEKRMIYEARKGKKQINRMKRMRRNEGKVEKNREDLKETSMRRKRNRFNRIVELRDRKWVNRGYDIMSNKNYLGIKCNKPMYVPNLERKKCLWDELKSDI